MSPRRDTRADRHSCNAHDQCRHYYRAAVAPAVDAAGCCWSHLGLAVEGLVLTQKGLNGAARAETGLGASRSAAAGDSGGFQRVLAEALRGWELQRNARARERGPDDQQLGPVDERGSVRRQSRCPPARPILQQLGPVEADPDPGV